MHKFNCRVNDQSDYQDQLAIPAVPRLGPERLGVGIFNGRYMKFVLVGCSAHWLERSPSKAKKRGSTLPPSEADFRQRRLNKSSLTIAHGLRLKLGR